MRRYFLILLWGCFSLIGYSQEKNIYKKIDSLVAVPNYAEAEKLILFTSTIISDFNRIGTLQNKLAEILITQGKLIEAEKTLNSLESNTSLTDPFVKAITHTNLGFLYLNKARHDLALQNLQKALNLFEESGKKNTEEYAKCLAVLSSLYLSTGKLNQAEANGLIALQIRQGTKGEASEEVAASYNDLGLVYSQKDVDKSLEYYEKALAVYEKLHSKEHPKIAIANTNIGYLYREMKLYGDAINNFESAEAIWKKIYPNGHPNQALALVNLGETYEDMGDKKASLADFEKAIAVYKKSFGDKHPDLSYVYNQIGALKSSEYKYDEALQSIQEAICANSPSFNEKAITRNPKATEYYNGKILLYSIRNKAKAFESKYFGKTLKFEDLKSALSCLYTCDTLIDDIRNHSSDENDKLELGASANEVYEDGVRIAHTMSEMTIDFKRYREIAFYFAEKSKSAVLQQSIADADAKSFAGIPAALLDEENNLKASIALLSQKLSQKPSADEEKILRENLFATNRQYESFVKRLEKDYPDYFNLKFSQVNPSIPELQKLLDDKTAIVCYFIAEARLYSFVITQNRFNIFNSTLPADFDKMIKGFNNSLYYTVHESYMTSNNILSSLLSRYGFCQGYHHHSCRPTWHDALRGLVIKKSQARFRFYHYTFPRGQDGHQLRVFSRPFTPKIKIFEAQSITIHLSVRTHFFPGKDHLDDLPGTSLEVSNIAKLFPSNFIAKNAEANESLIKSGKLADFRYLHFATHGVVDETSPELSRIYLQTSGAEDGNVFSGEIFNLKLNADLAVLSACQTGLGKFSKGEGVIGLSRALVYAGAKSIMVSYWSVADESTSELMTDFYKQLLLQSTPNFREALQQAKQKMIREKKYAAPYYWAPFVLIGF